VNGWDLGPAALLSAAVFAVLHAAGRVRLQRRGIAWPVGRDAAFGAGVACVLVAMSSPLAADDDWLPVHMAQHLLLGLAAPLAFALAAPVTLLLRVSGPLARRRLVAVLHSRPARALSWAPVGVLLSLALMWPLYVTPLYAATLHQPLLHDAVHLHMLASGCLLTFALVGADPIPGRGSFPVRVGSLFAALATHGILAKYLYIHATALSAAPEAGSAADWRLGAQVLWYGGDAVDVLLLIAFFAQWYRATGRQLHHEQRRLAAAERADADAATSSTTAPGRVHGRRKVAEAGACAASAQRRDSPA
jgi:putative membrane protein